LVHPKQATLIFKNFSLRKNLIKTILLVSSLFFIFVAILQPQWGEQTQQVMQEGRDLLIVLDISRSMQAQDLKPSRLEFAKLKIRHLLSRLHFDRVGLILFSGSAFVQCPLTVDQAAFLMFLDHVDTEVISSGTTAFDAALNKAMEVYGEAVGRKNKAVLLVTDGEDFSSNLQYAKQKALEQNIKVLALGIGSTQGAPIPIYDHQGNQVGHEKDGNGVIALTKLNEPLLQSLCQELGGIYFRAQYDDGDIDNLVGIIKKFEKEKFMDRKVSRYHDQYPWLLGLAWIVLLLEWLL
jgi:Ca-activated chloride channel family protein